MAKEKGEARSECTKTHANGYIEQIVTTRRDGEEAKVEKTFFNDKGTDISHKDFCAKMKKDGLKH